MQSVFLLCRPSIDARPVPKISWHTKINELKIDERKSAAVLRYAIKTKINVVFIDRFSKSLKTSFLNEILCDDEVNMKEKKTAKAF